MSAEDGPDPEVKRSKRHAEHFIKTVRDATRITIGGNPQLLTTEDGRGDPTGSYTLAAVSRHMEVARRYFPNLEGATAMRLRGAGWKPTGMALDPPSAFRLHTRSFLNEVIDAEDIALHPDKAWLVLHLEGEPSTRYTLERVRQMMQIAATGDASMRVSFKKARDRLVTNGLEDLVGVSETDPAIYTVGTGGFLSGTAGFLDEVLNNDGITLVPARERVGILPKWRRHSSWYAFEEVADLLKVAIADPKTPTATLRDVVKKLIEVGVPLPDEVSTYGEKPLNNYQHPIFGLLVETSPQHEPGTGSGKAVFRSEGGEESELSNQMLLEVARALSGAGVLSREIVRQITQLAGVKPKTQIREVVREPKPDEIFNAVVLDITKGADPRVKASQWLTKITNEITEALRGVDDEP